MGNMGVIFPPVDVDVGVGMKLPEWGDKPRGVMFSPGGGESTGVLWWGVNEGSGRHINR